MSVGTHNDPLDDPFAVWFAPTIDQSAIRALMKRNNISALATFAAWLVLCFMTGYLVIVSRVTLWALLPSMIAYGGILSFAYAASHECAHGTAFRARWLNEVVFWFTSIVFIEEPLYRRYSHAAHHTHTWFNGTDPQKPYGNPLTLSKYVISTLGFTMYLDAARQLTRHGLGHFTEGERGFLPGSELRNVSFNSRVMLALYISLLGYGIAFSAAWPFLLYFLPRWLGGWIVTAYINTQHMCMAENLYDHRKTTRSVRCNRFERLLYWNMNYHIEHHLYPAIPFHGLPALNKQIANQLPPPVNGVIAANVEILGAIARQRSDPNYNLSPVH